MEAVTSNNKECIQQQQNRKDGSDNDDGSRFTSTTSFSTTSNICSLPIDFELDEHLLHVSRLISGYYDDDKQNNFEEYDENDIAEVDDDESECSHIDVVKMVDRVPCEIEFSTTSLSMSASTSRSASTKKTKYPEYATNTTKRTINDEDHQLDSNKDSKKSRKFQLLLWAFESIDSIEVDDSKKSGGCCSCCGIATSISSSRSSSIVCFEGEEMSRFHREENKQRVHEQNGKKCFICSMYSELLE